MTAAKKPLFPPLTQRQKLSGLAATLVVSAVALTLCVINFKSSPHEGAETATPSHPGLTEIAAELQKYLPSQVDEATTLQDVTVEGPDMIVYDYIVQSAFYAMPGVVENMDEKVPGALEEKFCGPDAQDFRNMNVQVVYRYKDETGKFLNQYLLRTDECPA